MHLGAQCGTAELAFDARCRVVAASCRLPLCMCFVRRIRGLRACRARVGDWTRQSAVWGGLWTRLEASVCVDMRIPIYLNIPNPTTVDVQLAVSGTIA